MKNDMALTYGGVIEPPGSTPSTAAPAPLRLLDAVRSRIRVKHYSIRTEVAYLDWIKRYIRYFDKRPRAPLRS